MVSLLGTRRDCSLRWRGRFDLTSHRNRQCPCAARATLLLPAAPAILVRSGLHGVPSLAAHRSLRVHHHKHRRVIWATAKDQKTSQVLADEAGTLAQHPQPKENKEHLPHERWSPTNNRAVNSTPPCRRSLHTDHQVLNRPLQLALLQVFDPRAAQRKPFTNLEPSSGLEDNSVESKSQKEKNYANPVPQGLGKIRLSKASTLCIAVLVLERTDAMASWMKWPVQWAPADGHTCRRPLGASQQKKNLF